MLAEHLSDTLKGELLHQIDNIRLAQELVAEVLDSDWECCRVQQNLPILRQEAYKLLNDWLKLWRQQLVSLHASKESPATANDARDQAAGFGYTS